MNDVIASINMVSQGTETAKRTKKNVAVSPATTRYVTIKQTHTEGTALTYHVICSDFQLTEGNYLENIFHLTTS